MDLKRYEVEVVCRRRMVYVVEAADPEAAQRAAAVRWGEGEEGDPRGGECWDLEEVRAAEVPADEALSADREEVLRFLRDRELVLERLDADAFNPTVHDAMSAEEMARHLGWTTADGAQDVARAARALDGLCAAHRVVCFNRPRVRQGERGEVRLYCTPQHLERLSAMLDDDIDLALDDEDEMEGDEEELDGDEAGEGAEEVGTGAA